MNVIEAAKEAGMNVSLWDYGAGSIVFTMGTEGLARGALERFAQIIRNQALEDAAKKRASKPRKLPRAGTGALWEEQQFCYERGFREGAASVRSAIRAMKAKP